MNDRDHATFIYLQHMIKTGHLKLFQNQLEGFKTYDWDTLTTNWDDMDFDGKNNKIKYIHRSAEKSSDGVITKTSEIRKK